MSSGTAAWLVLVWRLPHGTSTARVSVWRSLRRLGAVVMTPGAAILPFRDELQEQLDWLAQEIEEQDGQAWVLTVNELSEAEASWVRAQAMAEMEAEYLSLRADAEAFFKRADEHPGPDADFASRLRTEKELLALQRRFDRVRNRDYYSAPGRREAAATIDRCLIFRQGISSKLKASTDMR